jgi:hypothetical protein
MPVCRRQVFSRRFEVLSAGITTLPVSKKERLVVSVLIEGGEVEISIDEQFRQKFYKPGKKYAIFTVFRLQAIRETQPKDIEVEYTGKMEFPFRVSNLEISAWFERVKKRIEKDREAEA